MRCGLECAPVSFGDRVPPTPRHVVRPATLAAWCCTSVSAALTTAALTREEVAVHVPTTEIPRCLSAPTRLTRGRCVPTAPVSLGDGVPLTPRHVFRPAALAARCCACVSTALTASTLTWEAVAVHVLTAEIARCRTARIRLH